MKPFTEHDPGSTEMEYLELLYALVRVLKPVWALETGTYLGYGTAAIARAMATNGGGRLITIDHGDRELEMRDKLPPQAADGRRDAGEPPQTVHVQYVRATAKEWLADGRTYRPPFGFAFLDSCVEDRLAELTGLVEGGLLTKPAFVAIHDCSENDGHIDLVRKFWLELPYALRTCEIRQWMHFPQSRGMTLLRVG